MIKFLQTPSRTKKIVLGGLLLIICAAMVITLVPGGILGESIGIGGPGQGVLARVGKEEVTTVQAQQLARNIVRQQFGGRSVPSQMMPYFVQQAMQSLVTQKVMTTEAARLGLSVNDNELADYLRNGPFAAYLFPKGQFIGQSSYQMFVEQSFDLPVPQFESELKNELLLTKLRNVVTGSVTVSDDQLRQEYVRQNTKVKFAYALLTLEEIAGQIKPADAELSSFFDKNKARYANALPEKRTVQYIVVDSARLKSKATVTADELKRYYNQHMDEFRVPEEVKVRHILIKTPAPGADGKVDPKAVDAARAKAEDLLKKIKAGGNFAELAKKNSDDPGSAPKGGDLGWIGRGRTVPEFEKTAFALKPGETSGVVQSSYGFHIIQMQESHTAHLKTLDEVKAQIEPAIEAQKTAEQAEAQANGVQSQARTSGLAAAAQKGGLGLQSATISRDEPLPGIGAAPETIAAIFSVREKSAPEALRYPGGFIVFQVQAVQPPQTPTFAQIRGRVEQDFRQERASQLLTQRLQQLADRARAGHNLNQAAKEVGAAVKTSELVLPTAQVPDIGSLAGPAAVVFDMKPGDISAPVQTARGGAVLSLVDKQPPDPAGFDQRKEPLRQELLERQRGETFRLFVDNLRSRMEKQGKIRLNKKEIERLGGREEAS
jgi:peptidyl-prolyl cis-trans isomerase D